MRPDQSMTFRPGEDADLLEGLAVVLGTTYTETLRRGLRCLAAQRDTAAKVKVHQVVEYLKQARGESV